MKVELKMTARKTRHVRMSRGSCSPSGRSSGDGMNSQLKDALNEFMNRNSAAIDQAMENTNHAKDEPLIQDLVNYLSGTKDNQTVPMEDRSSVQHSLSCETNLELTPVVHFKSPPPKSKSEGILSTNGHVHGSDLETSLSADTRLHLLMNDQEPSQYQHHHNSFEQNISPFPYSVNHRSCPDNIPDVNLNSSTFDRPRDHHSNEAGVSSLLAAGDTQYNRSEDSVQFASNTDRRYNETQNTQFPNTENGTGQFQNVSQICSNGFKDSSVSSPFTTSASSQMPYTATHDGRGYGFMDVTLASVNNIEANSSQTKVPEKMQTDEPEAVFQQAAVPTNDGQYHAAQMQTLDAAQMQTLDAAQMQTLDAHLQAYCSSNFNLLSALNDAQSSAATSTGPIGCGFEPNLTDTVGSHSSADFNGASVVTAATTFDLSVNTCNPSLSGHVNACQSSLSGPLTSQNFQENISEPTSSSMQASATNFQGQPSPCQVNLVSSDTAMIQHSGSTGSHVSSSPSSACLNHNSGYLSPCEDNQYQDTATHGHPSSSISDVLKISIANSSSPVAGLSPNHQLYQHSNFDSSYQHSPSSHQSSPINPDHYQQNPTAGSNYTGNSTVVHSLDQHVITYQGNSTSHLSLPVTFAETATANDPNQQQYVSSSLAQATESYFMKSTSVTTDLATLKNICSTQNMTEYTRLDSSNPANSLTNSNNSLSDVTMRELPVESHLHSFSHLDFQSMVNNFSAQGDTSTVLENNCSATSSLMFSQVPNPVVETTSHFNLHQQGQPVEILASYMPNSSTTMLNSRTGEQPSESQFGSSTFDLSSTSQMADLHFTSQMSMNSFPQPMQVQDSEFLNKMPASFSHRSSAANDKSNNINTETSMDTSSDLREHHGNASHRISFEEIHMSIVKAGDRLSQELCGTSIEQTMFCKSTLSLVDKAEPTGCFSDMPSLRGLGTFNTRIDDTACNNIKSDHPILQSAVNVSESTSLQSSENVSLSQNFKNDSNATHIITNSSSAPSALPNLNVGHSLFVNILSNSQTQTASDQLQAENLIIDQPAVTVPHFLQSPAPGNTSSSNSHPSFKVMDAAEGHQHFVVTTTSATPLNSDTTFSSSGNQFPGDSVVTEGSARNLLQYLSSLSQSRTGLVETSRDGTTLQSSQNNPTVSLNLAETTVYDPALSSETSLHMESSIGASNTSNYSNTLNESGVLEAGTVYGSSDTSSEHFSTKGNADPGAVDASNNQPNIIVSLEDLQQLILEQKLHSSSPVLHQLSHGTASSPQTLVIQKHASHSLRQIQPRLTVKGMTLSNSHVTNPHQHTLHARDSTQLLQHKTQQNDHISDADATSQRHPELGVIFRDQESQQQLNSNPFHIPLVSLKDQQEVPSKPMEQQSQPMPIEQQPQPKIQLQFQHSEAYQQQKQQQTFSNFFKENSNPNDNSTSLQQHLVLLHGHQQIKKDQNYVQTDPPSHQQTVNNFLKENSNPNDNSTSLQQHLVLLHGHQQIQTGQNYVQTDPSSHQHIQDVTQAALKQLELNQVQKQERQQHLNGQQMRAFPVQFKDHLHSMEQPDRNDRPCNDSLKTPQSSEAKDSVVHMDSTISASMQSMTMLKAEDPTNSESHAARDSSSNKQTSLLAQILTERKRCHSPLSVSLYSPMNSNSEDGSPLSSPTFDDGNTQLTLIERSASLQIKSDHPHGTDDGADDDENAIFDLTAFHKRPSADESHSSRDNNVNVPMKVAKPSVDADPHTSINPPSSPEPKFDFGGAISSASNFSFGSKDRNNPLMFTFGSSSTVLPTNEPQQYKDGSNHNRPSCSKPVAKAVGMRSALPTQPVRPTSRRQKEYSLKACYPGKVDGMELKILAQPEPQHRARYQTEGSRGAIKDESQQGYPIIKLFGYSQATKLQVYIGDEGGRTKPHGFYQACRVSGKNSTTCVEQEIEGTVVLEVEMLPENNMTVKLDCIGILKLRNADVEGRIGPKRARDKKRTNTRARLVMRCSIEKSDGRQYFLQVASNPIVCTQPVGQAEISRMSLTECNVHGGDSLFIIGKNFRNKGTTVLFQTLDSTDDYVTWQAEAQIEQEYFQPTHLICKIPPYKDRTITSLQEAQIVVSCAGKMSDPHSFIYKPVYQVPSSVKQEVLMETDTNVAPRTLSFVSPEALHLNRMVQQTHAQSSPTGLFQLPANTFPEMQTAVVKSPSATTFKGLRPAMLTNLSQRKPEVPSLPVCITAKSSTSASVVPPSPTSGLFVSGPSKNSLAGSLLHLSQQSSGFGEKYNCNGFVQKSSGQPTMTLPVSDAITNSSTVSSLVTGNQNTQLASSIQRAISKSHPMMTLVSATSAVTIVGPTDPSLAVTGPIVGHIDPHSTVAGPTVSHTGLVSTIAGPTVSHTDPTSSVTTSRTPAPFLLVVDPAVFQSSTGGDKIQQLLMQILEAQSKLI